MKDENKVEKNILGISNKIAYDTIISGTTVPDGKYKVKLKAKKKISGAYGYRESEKELDYIIDYKYPIPNCVSYDIIPFFKINYDISTEKYSVNYAYNLNFSFDKSEKIDGAIVYIEENGKTTSKDFEAGNVFETYYISNLPQTVDEEKEITTKFNFKYHDFVDNIFKRQKELFLQKSHMIDNVKLESYRRLLDIDDNLTKVYKDNWEELDPSSLEKIDTSNYQTVKSNTLPYIPKLKRKQMEYNGILYNFFYEIDGGPFYRSRIFKRYIGREYTILKRYDSVPIIDENPSENFIQLLSIKDNLKMGENNSFIPKKIYSNYSDTMSLIFEYKFVDNDGRELLPHEIDYAFFEMFDSTGNLYESYDMKKNKKIEFYNVPIGLYTYKIVTHNDFCLWNDNVYVSENPIVAKPSANEVLKTSYVLVPSFDKLNSTANISWELYGKDIVDLSLHLYDITNPSKITLVNRWESPKYNNVTIDTLEANHKYRYYFSFNSNNCVFPEDKRVLITDFETHKI